jgi:hypothetical protein
MASLPSIKVVPTLAIITFMISLQPSKELVSTHTRASSSPTRRWPPSTLPVLLLTTNHTNVRKESQAQNRDVIVEMMKEGLYIFSSFTTDSALPSKTSAAAYGTGLCKLKP